MRIVIVQKRLRFRRGMVINERTLKVVSFYECTFINNKES